jgi:hypothetical protein
MLTACVAAFNPKVWTYTTTPRKIAFSELAWSAGLPVPALPFAQRGPRYQTRIRAPSFA